jgi:hypothetical protein
MNTNQSLERIPGYCVMCISRCGSMAVVDKGQFVALCTHRTGRVQRTTTGKSGRFCEQAPASNRQQPVAPVEGGP